MKRWLIKSSGEQPSANGKPEMSSDECRRCSDRQRDEELRHELKRYLLRKAAYCSEKMLITGLALICTLFALRWLGLISFHLG